MAALPSQTSIALESCSIEPEPISYSVRECAHCGEVMQRGRGRMRSALWVCPACGRHQR